MWFRHKKTPPYFPVTVAMCPEIRDWIFTNCKEPIQINNHAVPDGGTISVYFFDEVEATWCKLLFAGKTAEEIAEQVADPIGERRRALIAGTLRKKLK